MASILSKSTLLRQDGSPVDSVEFVASANRIALYFSGHFCAPCRSFTPSLKEFVEEVNEDHKNLDMVFVSLDKNEEDQIRYHSEEMGDWPRVAFSDETSRTELKEKYGVEKIPALIVLGQDKETLQIRDGVNDVKNMGPMAYEMKWTAA